MAAPTHSAALPEITPEIQAFAEQSGVAPYLPAVLELLPRTFPTARRFVALVEDDPEIANDRHIVFEVFVPEINEETRAARRRFTEGLFACCPSPLVCVFRLSIDLAS
jgi:hypothetical protein